MVSAPTPSLIGVFMRFSRVLLLISIATGLTAQTPAWDTSGNGMLNGTYYFRQVVYEPSVAGDGTLYNALAFYGTATFSGTGTYTMVVTLLDGRSGQFTRGNVNNGTYSIAASGHGFLSSPLFPGSGSIAGDSICRMVNAQGIFVGSSTEKPGLQRRSSPPRWLRRHPRPPRSRDRIPSRTWISPAAIPATTIGGMLQMNSDGAGNVGTVGFAGYVGQNGSSKVTQSVSNVKYTFSNGAGVVTFPNSTTALFTGQYYLYFSPDGNFVFGGSPNSFDLLVGVRTGTGTPNLNDTYYEVGLDQDESTLGSGYAGTDSFYGSFRAKSGTMVGHQRLLNFFNPSAYDYTYSDTYTIPSNGAYTSPATNYVVGSGIRIGSGIGPLLGISVALPAPTMSSSLSTTGVFLDPQGIVNAGSFAPFTAGVAPGELLTLFGANLASGLQVASTIPFPTTLNKVQVMINSVPAPIYYVSPTQLAVVVLLQCDGRHREVAGVERQRAVKHGHGVDRRRGGGAHPTPERPGVRGRGPSGWHPGHRQESRADRRNGVGISHGAGYGEPRDCGRRRRARQSTGERYQHDYGLYRRNRG